MPVRDTLQTAVMKNALPAEFRELGVAFVIKTRVWFKKLGAAKYISHLDLMRTFTRVFRMSGVPIWYTEGFNPHPFMTFAQPLPVGTEALKEAVDIKLTEETDLALVLEKIRAVSPDCLPVFDVTAPVYKFADISHALYSITVETSAGQSTIREFFRNPITMEKAANKKKKGSTNRIITTQIPLESIECDGEFTRIQIITPAGSKENISPSLVLDALAKECGPLNIHSMVRECLYTPAGELS